jgi:hypothetical protein
MLVAATWVASGLVLGGSRSSRSRSSRAAFAWWGWVGAASSVGLILASFLIHVGTPEDPGFLWWLFGLGYGIGLATLALWLGLARRSSGRAGR